MRQSGFTLSELLIALAILGLLAVFTIPKVLQSQQEGRFKAIGKETVMLLDGAYKNYALSNTPGAGTGPGDLTPFMNYVRQDTVGEIDREYDGTTYPCQNSNVCYELHNGAKIRIRSGGSFAGVEDTNAISILLDPDGKVTSTGLAGTEGKSVRIFLYLGGRITSWADILPNTCDDQVCRNPDNTKDPPWFSWN